MAMQAGIHVEFIEAVEGKNLDIARVASYDRRKRTRYLKDLESNEIACVLSHRLALEAFIASTDDYGVVLEDDAVFPSEIDTEINSLLNSVEGFDLLKLESRDNRGTLVSRQGGRALFLPIKASHGSTAILYTREGARRVLESLANFHHSFDTHIGFGWKTGLICLACWPPLITEDKRQRSTIGGRGQAKRQSGLRGWFAARIERIQHSIMKRLHNRKIKNRIILRG